MKTRGLPPTRVAEPGHPRSPVRLQISDVALPPPALQSAQDEIGAFRTLLGGGSGSCSGGSAIKLRRRASAHHFFAFCAIFCRGLRPAVQTLFPALLYRWQSRVARPPVAFLRHQVGREKGLQSPVRWCGECQKAADGLTLPWTVEMRFGLSEASLSPEQKRQAECRGGARREGGRREGGAAGPSSAGWVPLGDARKFCAEGSTIGVRAPRLSSLLFPRPHPCPCPIIPQPIHPTTPPSLHPQSLHPQSPNPRSPNPRSLSLQRPRF